MKYANSLKYMNGFASAPAEEDISRKRVSELCNSLGRINIGAGFICIPEGAGGHGVAVLLERIIAVSGYRVGRITSCEDFDSRVSVYVNGEIPPIEDYNKAVAELKGAVLRSKEEYYKQEVTFALALLLCKLSDCDYIILEGLGNDKYSLDSVCAPYDLIIMPTVYCNDNPAQTLKHLCEAIRRGVREVISGNQKSEVYNIISNACAMSGVRLYIPVKSQFVTRELTPRRIGFDYNGKEGYTMKSPSCILRDCAMIAIEASLAIRRSGIKMPWNAIINGLATATGMSSFEVISASPMIVTDSSSSREEAELLLKTLEEVSADASSVVLAVKCRDEKHLEELVDVFAEVNVSKLIILSDSPLSDSFLAANGYDDTVCEDVGEVAAKALALSEQNSLVVCLGSVSFADAVKAEMLRIMSY